MRKKFTMLLASLFLMMGTVWAQVLSDGVYTIQADVDGKRGYLAAGKDGSDVAYARPVLVDISWDTYAGNSATPLDENSKYWYLTTRDGVSYLYNISKDGFIFDDGAGAISFNAAPCGLNVTEYTSGGKNYIHVGSGTGTRFLSMGCGTTAPNQVNWETISPGDGGCLLTFTAVENGATTYATQITAANAKIDELYANAFDPTKLYRVYNKKKNDNGTYADTENMAWSPEGNHLAVYNAEAENQLWRFIQGTGDNAEKYLIYNVATGKYMREVVGSNGVQLTANENEAVYYTMKKHASEDKYAFCSRNEQKYHLYNDGGGKLAGWTANDNEYFTLEAVDVSVDVTYSFKFDGVEKYTQTESLNAGDKYPDFNVTLPYGVSAEAKPAGRVGLTDVNADVELTTSSLPFEYAADYASIKHWYYMNIDSDAPKYLFYEENDEAMDISGKNTVDAENKDAYSWAFVGDPFNGYQIVNRAAGESMILSAPVNTYDGNTGGNTYPVLKASASITETHNTLWIPTAGNVANGFYLEQKGHSANKMNYRDPNLAFWNAGQGPGSTFQVVDRGVEDLASLNNLRVYTLAAERSPLMYSATENMTTKLSSGLVDDVKADAKDVNQQFLIISTSDTPDGLYYLYSVAAGKFVAEDLTFTDLPYPVLSFEDSKNKLYPFFVKIDGKYVVPGAAGTAGNTLYHQESVQDDDGKRYRIVEAGAIEMSAEVSNFFAKIGEAEDMVRRTSELSNDKVYTVLTYDRGGWCYNEGQADNLWSTGKDAFAEYDPSSTAQQFAFLTVEGDTYLYSVGAQKFVVKNGDHAGYSDLPTQPVNFLASQGNAFYPFVVALGESQIAISNGHDIPVITYYNDLSDGGNRVRITEVGEFTNKDAVLTVLQNYHDLQTLHALVAEAEELLSIGYLVGDKNTALASAKDVAKTVAEDANSTPAQVVGQIELLTAAIATARVINAPADFHNGCVYTLVTKRGWMGAMDGNNNVISTSYQKSVTPSAEDANFQWVVYKSTREHYYLYNIGKQQFVGVQSSNNAAIPFAATPQGLNMAIKTSAWADYPIMFSTDNKGVINHSNDRNPGVVNWADGWNKTDDEGSNHKVLVVGAVEQSLSELVAAAVELYETQGVAIQVLDAAIAAAQAKINGMGEGLGYYSSTDADPTATLAAIVEFKNTITAETTVAAIEEKTAAVNTLAETFSINLPEAGKFYRIKNNGETGYLSGDHATSGRTHFVDGIENSASSIFYFDGTKLLAYTTGLYLAKGTDEDMVHYTQTVGESAGTTFAFSASPVVGKLLITFNNGNRSFYSAGLGQTDAAGSGQTGNHYRFTVEEVTTLPVAVSAAGYATLFAPVALTIPTEDVMVYTATATVDGTTLNLKALTGTIPAETGVIIEAAQGTYNFDVAADVDPISGNALTGKYAKSVKNAEMKVYTLQMPNKEDKNSVGFYLFNGTDGTKTTYINGFRAWVELPADSNVQALRFTRGDEEDTTGIESVEANEELVIFDLAGRRVQKMEKGIYIVNGKKVVIK